jgi:hypothetical protein
VAGEMEEAVDELLNTHGEPCNISSPKNCGVYKVGKKALESYARLMEKK